MEVWSHHIYHSMMLTYADQGRLQYRKYFWNTFFESQLIVFVNDISFSCSILFTNNIIDELCAKLKKIYMSDKKNVMDHPNFSIRWITGWILHCNVNQKWQGSFLTQFLEILYGNIYIYISSNMIQAEHAEKVTSLTLKPLPLTYEIENYFSHTEVRFIQ